MADDKYIGQRLDCRSAPAEWGPILLATFCFNPKEITVSFTVSSRARNNQLILGFLTYSSPAFERGSREDTIPTAWPNGPTMALQITKIWKGHSSTSYCWRFLNRLGENDLLTIECSATLAPHWRGLPTRTMTPCSDKEDF